MLKIKNLSIAVFLVFLLSACGGGTPKGSDTEVKNIVIDITIDEVRRQLAPVMYQKVTNIPVGVIGIKITYEGLVEKINSDQNAQVVAAIDEVIDEMTISLENIRIDSINEEIKKSENSADIVINGKSNPIQYTAQRNSEGDIYVEVFGL